jgi:hypothetical protein
MRAGAGAEEVTQFIVASTESVGRSRALEPTHRLISTFDATVILLQSIVEVAAGAVLHAFTQCRPDRTRVAVVAIRGYPVRGNIGDGLGGLEERLRSRHVTVLAEHHVDQRAAAVDGAIQIAPLPVHLDVRVSRPEEFHPRPLAGRVEDWRAAKIETLDPPRFQPPPEQPALRG